MNILFVCSGNTCRSPMAEAMLEEMADESDILDGHIKVKSCGTFAAEGAQATENAQKVMEEMDVGDLRKHKSRQFDAELAEWADVILAMQSSQVEEIEAMVPECEGKASTLLGYLEGIIGFPGESAYDIDDPYGGDMDDYRECAADLKRAVSALVAKLEHSNLF